MLCDNLIFDSVLSIHKTLVGCKKSFAVRATNLMISKVDLNLNVNYNFFY